MQTDVSSGRSSSPSTLMSGAKPDTLGFGCSRLPVSLDLPVDSMSIETFWVEKLLLYLLLHLLLSLLLILPTEQLRAAQD